MSTVNAAMVSTPSPFVAVIRRAVRRLKNKPRQSLALDIHYEYMGSDYGGYAVDATRLDANSVVYSFGVGEDASFDVALIERFGLQVHAFDPTPKSIAWVQAQDLPEQFHFHPYGVADYDGTASFNPPINPDHVSHTMLERAETAAQAVEVPVHKVRTLMEKLGHTKVDLIKMDIEGAEYPVVEQMIADELLPPQLMLEYHHQLKGVPLSRTEASLDALERVGYRVFHESERGHEFSLLRMG